jgi:IS1 family transposase
MVIRNVCPQCKSPRYKKNGHIHNGKQNHQCHGCGRQFVQCFEQYLIVEDKRRLIARLLVERISLRGICRAVGVTLKWIWLAMDATSRQVIAFHVGDRSRSSAKQLWAKIPEAYRQHATFYTDHYVVYEGVIPAAQHKAISKLARKTNHLERFNSTLRQRVSRLVRAALSFSKKLANHIGAIKLFICHYNLTRAVA